MTTQSLGHLDISRCFVSSLVRLSQTFIAATLSCGGICPTLGTRPLDQMEEMYLYYLLWGVKFCFFCPSFCLFKNKHTIIRSLQWGDYISANIQGGHRAELALSLRSFLYSNFHKWITFTITSLLSYFIVRSQTTPL